MARVRPGHDRPRPALAGARDRRWGTRDLEGDAGGLARALEQRCTVHALRNVTSKLPERHHQEIKTRWWKAFDEARSPGEARRELQGIIEDYRPRTPPRWPSSRTDLPALITHLRFPSQHRKRIRTTNLLERTFVEVRRRTKVIGRFPGETSALSLIWAVLELTTRGWRGVKMNPKTVAEIERLRRELRDTTTTPPATRTPRRPSPHNIPLKRSLPRTNSPGKRDATQPSLHHLMSTGLGSVCLQAGDDSA